MMKAQKVLIADSVRFYSACDEDLFFAWIGKIPCISKCEGKGVELFLTVDRDRVEDGCLREMLALFLRYEVDMGQLSDFMTEKNASWFFNKNSYWYEKVFENR